MKCNDVKENLLDFYNHKISSQKYIEIANHISKCDDCKKELALLIKISKLKRPEKDVPQNILNVAFSKIPTQEKQNLYTMLNNLYYSIKITKQVTKLAFEII